MNVFFDLETAASGFVSVFTSRCLVIITINFTWTLKARFHGCRRVSLFGAARLSLEVMSVKDGKAAADLTGVNRYLLQLRAMPAQQLPC